MAAEGILVEVVDGFARIQFMDRSKTGSGLAALIAVGGAELIDVDTRSEPRKVYIVPESIAVEAGLLDPAPDAAPIVLPDGAPDGDWTVIQLREFAAREEIDLGAATKKADILAAIAAASAPQQ
jgi:hypothetical protein